MFCWGTHEGGQRWCEYLANKEEGNYVELQAGLGKILAISATNHGCM